MKMIYIITSMLVSGLALAQQFVGITTTAVNTDIFSASQQCQIEFGSGTRRCFREEILKSGNLPDLIMGTDRTIGCYSIKIASSTAYPDLRKFMISSETGLSTSIRENQTGPLGGMVSESNGRIVERIGDISPCPVFCCSSL